MRILACLVVGAALAAGCAPGVVLTPETPSPALYDVVLLGGLVMDPESGLDAVRNIGISGGTVQIITTEPIRGRTSVDAHGLVVAPGFIDLNLQTHTPAALRARSLDGVTAAFETLNGAGDIDEWYAALEDRSILHFGATIGHLSVRRTVLLPATSGDTTSDGADLPANPTEIMQIRRGVEYQLGRGALGVSLDLGYDELGTTPRETIEIFRAAASFTGAPVHVAPRKTTEDWLETGELFLATLVTGAPLHISGAGNFYGSDFSLLVDMIEVARGRGLDITVEAYPYSAGAAPISHPNYAGWTDWPEETFARFRSPLTNERLTRESFGRYRATGGLVVVELNTEENVSWVIASSPAMIVSFGDLRDGAAHPRLAGTYARVLGHYVRERELLTLMDALRKMTLIPAQHLEARAPAMQNKGRIRVGADADITIFNPRTVLDRATYASPHLPPDGICYVLVGGVLVVDRGQPVAGVQPGRAIRGAILGE